ncbi:hypothetical protein [Notoacmeibacter sp. MSK16QG-6]|uniref:hypothetical protein n=1 Tax=Notoacmeibacter sp. MSK16QG-6 TaxID=2957982 RepID=UPI0020A153A3|nr:hypothetical protein [Notoacmeibacter sp. MSK16QG-6]MCP1199832.1 hypothetical protein [Notoacmeibacter sp. MSK16QG-6]
MRTFSIAILSFVLFAAGSQAAFAAPRINIDGASCRDARRIVAQNGAAILRYSSRQSNRLLYDRFVADSYFCQSDEVALPKTIFRREGTCRLLTCQIPDYEDRFRRPWIFR